MIGPSYDQFDLASESEFIENGFVVDGSASVTRLLIGVSGASFSGKKARLGIGYHAALGMTTEMRSFNNYYGEYDTSLLPLRTSLGIQGIWRWVIDDELAFELGLCGSYDSYSWVESDTDEDSLYTATVFNSGVLLGVTYALSPKISATATVSLIQGNNITTSKVYIDGKLSGRKGLGTSSSMLFSIAYMF